MFCTILILPFYPQGISSYPKLSWGCGAHSVQDRGRLMLDWPGWLIFNQWRAKSHIIDPLALLCTPQLSCLSALTGSEYISFQEKPSQPSSNISVRYSLRVKVSKISQLCSPGAQPLPAGRCGLERDNYTPSCSSLKIKCRAVWLEIKYKDTHLWIGKREGKTLRVD